MIKFTDYDYIAIKNTATALTYEFTKHKDYYKMHGYKTIWNYDCNAPVEHETIFNIELTPEAAEKRYNYWLKKGFKQTSKAPQNTSSIFDSFKELPKVESHAKSYKKGLINYEASF